MSISVSLIHVLLIGVLSISAVLALTIEALTEASRISALAPETSTEASAIEALTEASQMSVSVQATSTEASIIEALSMLILETHADLGLMGGSSEIAGLVSDHEVFAHVALMATGPDLSAEAIKNRPI